LKIPGVGIHDNFFEIGGDSIVSIQVVSKANEAELPLTVKQVFDLQTVAAIAAQIESTLVNPIAELNFSSVTELPTLSNLSSAARAKLNESDVQYMLPLTPMQEGMLFHSLKEQLDSEVYLTQFSYKIKADSFNPSLFKKCWEIIFARHDVLRTFFVWEAKELRQVISISAKPEWEELDWRGYAFSTTKLLFTLVLTLLFCSRQPDKPITDQMSIDRKKGFSLTTPPSRFTLVRVDDDYYEFVWTFHHIILDGWSVALIESELSMLYASPQVQLPTPASFQSFVMHLKAQNMDQAKQYWQSRMKGFVASTPLPLSKNVLSTPNPIYASHKSSLPVRPLQDFAKKHKLTINTLLQAAWALVLSLHSREQDIVFGATVSGRSTFTNIPGIDKIVGLCINTLPTRVSTRGHETVIAWLRSIQTSHIEASQFEFASLSSIQAWSDLPKGVAAFDTVLAFENLPVDAKLEDGGIEIVSQLTAGRTSVPLNIIIGVLDGNLHIELLYDTERFTSTALSTIQGHLHTIIGALVKQENETRTLDCLNIISDTELDFLVNTVNSLELDFPTTETIHHAFEVQAGRTPDRVAAIIDDEHVTFAQLNARCNKLARFLVQIGVRPGSFISVCLPRSIQLLVSLLATMKAGCSYIPIDPTYPEARQRFMLEDSSSVILLTDKQSTFKPSSNIPIVRNFIPTQ